MFFFSTLQNEIPKGRNGIVIANLLRCVNMEFSLENLGKGETLGQIRSQASQDGVCGG